MKIRLGSLINATAGILEKVVSNPVIDAGLTAVQNVTDGDPKTKLTSNLLPNFTSEEAKTYLHEQGKDPLKDYTAHFVHMLLERYDADFIKDPEREAHIDNLITELYEEIYDEGKSQIIDKFVK